MGEKEDERKKGRRTTPFFLGDKVLLETWLWTARGWVGAGGAYALRLSSHDAAIRMKPLSIPQNSRVLWVAENYCRAGALSILHSNQTMSYQLMYHLPSGSALMEEITLHSMAHSTLLHLTLHPLHLLLSPLPAKALSSNHSVPPPQPQEV